MSYIDVYFTGHTKDPLTIHSYCMRVNMDFLPRMGEGFAVTRLIELKVYDVGHRADGSCNISLETLKNMDDDTMREIRMVGWVEPLKDGFNHMRATDPQGLVPPASGEPIA